MRHRFRQSNGFTLVELIVVIAILGILALVLVPRLLSVLDTSRCKSGMETAEQIKSALERYRMDYKQYPQTTRDWATIRTQLLPYANVEETDGDNHLHLKVYQALPTHALEASQQHRRNYVMYMETTHNQRQWVKITPDAVTGEPCDSQFVYENDFQSSAGSEWSSQSITTATGNQKFLGEFSNGDVTLGLANLPAHTHVTLTFDLYIIKSWDGNANSLNPDRWEVGVTGSGALFDTIFANVAGRRQSYPDSSASGANYVMKHWATEVNTLGYDPNWGGDATYRIHLTFAHTGSNLQLYFKGIDLQNVGDESWGLDNVRVSVLSR